LIFDEKLEYSTAPELKEHQNKWLKKLVRYAYKNAPAVKQIFVDAGILPSDISTLSDLQKIPTTPKDQLVKQQRENPPFGGFLATPADNLRRIYVSPGPLYHPSLTRIRGGVEDRLTRAFREFGFGRGDKILNTYSYHMVPAGLLFDDALTSMGITIIPAGTGNSTLQAQILHDLQITCIIASTPFLMTLLTTLEESGYDFKNDLSLRTAIITGEPGRGEDGWFALRKNLKDKYNLQTFSFYGTAELGTIGYECKYRNGYHLFENIIVEIVDPLTGKQLNPGQSGEVVITAFNMRFPILRLGTGDISYITEGKCQCGRTSPRLGLISGRVGEGIRVRELFVYPGQLDRVAAAFPQVSRYQMKLTRQGEKDIVTFRVELVKEVGEKDQILKAIGEKIQEVCTVRANFIDLVPPGTLDDNSSKILDMRWR